jgi:Transposase DDE domain
VLKKGRPGESILRLPWISNTGGAGGQSLRILSHCYDTQRRIYAAPGGVCRICELRAQCTSSLRGRRISRHLQQEYVDRVRSYQTTDSSIKAMRTRQVRVEPLFAGARAWHALRRLRLRGLMNATIQELLIAAEENRKRLLAASGWGQDHDPGGSLLAIPREPGRLQLSSGDGRSGRRPKHRRTGSGGTCDEDSTYPRPFFTAGPVL